MNQQHCLNNTYCRCLAKKNLKVPSRWLCCYRGGFLLVWHISRWRMLLREFNSLSVSLCSQGQLRRTCSGACCVFLARVQCCWTPTAPPSQRPRARPGAWRSCPVTQVGEPDYSADVASFCSVIASALALDLHVCLHACICIHAYFTPACSV